MEGVPGLGSHFGGDWSQVTLKYFEVPGPESHFGDPGSPPRHFGAPGPGFPPVGVPGPTFPVCLCYC